jgi:GNAT superfamily N-acetyltransferase
MTAADLDLVIEWAAAEGWNPGHQDAACFRTVDPDGFIIGLLDGAPIASISAVNYDAGFSFLGLYIVRPDMRGRGYGLRVWKAAMAHGSGRNIGLDGVVAQQENYKKSGFTLAYRNVRYAGRAKDAPHSSRVVSLTQVPFDRVAVYDRRFFPAARSDFLRAWITQPGHVGLGLVDGQGALIGYGVVRPSRQGAKIGPLFADSEAAAEELFAALSAQAGGGDLYLDVPEPNPAAVGLAERHGMTPVFETARMYTGLAPDIDLRRIFGVTSFELG